MLDPKDDQGDFVNIEDKLTIISGVRHKLILFDQHLILSVNAPIY